VDDIVKAKQPERARHPIGEVFDRRDLTELKAKSELAPGSMSYSEKERLRRLKKRFDG
jgi:hypothetical protein